MRGTAEDTQPGRDRRRFIPAHAGNGARSLRSSSAKPVHPRACGERRGSPSGRSSEAGSSPRMRGTEGQRAQVLLFPRFIPAHAGNGAPFRIHPHTSPVHPRACGERVRVMPRTWCSSGSSPRMRGNGRRPGRRQRVRPVHPRACEERSAKSNDIGVEVGSSPRMRGTALRHRIGSSPQRFIPAHAGNGAPARGRRSRTAVHPRACGERAMKRNTSTNAVGSSPRMRGTAAGSQGAGKQRRFIPAHAGNGRR